MNLEKKMVYQCRKPDGSFGRVMAKVMNKGHSKLAKWGTRDIVIKPDFKILDIGCGGGQNVFNFTSKIKNGKVYGVDYSETSVKISKKKNQKNIAAGKVEISHQSVSSLDFPDNYFDLISGFETYYFWPDLINDLKQIRSKLKPNGTFILINEVFICENEKLRKRNENWSKIGKFPCHQPQQVGDFLKEAGFSDIHVDIEENDEYFRVYAKK